MVANSTSNPRIVPISTLSILSFFTKIIRSNRNSTIYTKCFSLLPFHVFLFLCFEFLIRFKCCYFIFNVSDNNVDFFNAAYRSSAIKSLYLQRKFNFHSQSYKLINSVICLFSLHLSTLFVQFFFSFYQTIKLFDQKHCNIYILQILRWCFRCDVALGLNSTENRLTKAENVDCVCGICFKNEKGSTQIVANALKYRICTVILSNSETIENVKWKFCGSVFCGNKQIVRLLLEYARDFCDIKKNHFFHHRYGRVHG